MKISNKIKKLLLRYKLTMRFLEGVYITCFVTSGLVLVSGTEHRDQHHHQLLSSHHLRQQQEQYGQNKPENIRINPDRRYLGEILRSSFSFLSIFDDSYSGVMVCSNVTNTTGTYYNTIQMTPFRALFHLILNPKDDRGSCLPICTTTSCSNGTSLVRSPDGESCSCAKPNDTILLSNITEFVNVTNPPLLNQTIPPLNRTNPPLNPRDIVVAIVGNWTKPVIPAPSNTTTNSTTTILNTTITNSTLLNVTVRNDTSPLTTNTTTTTTTNSSFVCGPNARWNIFGQFCQCKRGYKGNPVVGCIDRDECSRKLQNPCGYNAICTNTPGSYNCTCQPGYKGFPPNCVMGCDSPFGSPCGPDHTCTDTPTGYNCTLLDYVRSYCPAGCSPNESCLLNSTENRFTCQCDSGYYRPNQFFPCQKQP